MSQAALILQGYLLRAAKVSKEQELGLTRDRKKFDIKEEYFVSMDCELSMKAA